MAKRKTKEIILFKALNLFADRGYAGVSVRDIAAGVGIRQSSLYKHYKSKQEIFDTLVETMKAQFSEAASSFQLPEGEIEEIAKEYAHCGTESLKKMSSSIFQYYLNDSDASQFRKMLSIEKYKNKGVEKIYREIYIDAAISYQASIFSKMIELGFMRQADTEVMALQFFAPIFVLLSKYEGMPEMESEALELLGRHIEQFDVMYRKECG